MREKNSNSLGLSDQYHELVLNGEKTSTVRLGHVVFADSNLMLTFENKPNIQVEIQEVIHDKNLKDLTEKDAQKDGFESLSKLKTALSTFYPDITEDSKVTVVCFELVI